MNASFYNRLIVSLVILFMLACSEGKHASPENEFKRYQSLVAIDSINLESVDILNPATIQYKNDFLVFSTLTGKKELQFLDLSTMCTITRYVVGQGAGEMSAYVVLDGTPEKSFRFADYRKGLIYDLSLEALRNDTTTRHTLYATLPIEKGDVPLRYYDSGRFIWGVGLLREGRFYRYDKQKQVTAYCGAYPSLPECEGLDPMHLGALFNRTLIAGDDRHLVAAYSGMLEFYEVTAEEDLRLIKEYRYFFPRFQSQQQGTPITFKSDDPFGCLEMTTDRQHVYLLYSADNLKDSGTRAFSSSDLYVYDWDGNPLQHYRLSHRLSALTVNGDIVYGLSRESIPKVYLFKIPKG
ncbi:MAG: BF3164 family lipoprotein [Bacteroides sp.]